MAVRLRTMKIKGKATALAGNIRSKFVRDHEGRELLEHVVPTLIIALSPAADHMRAVLLALHTPGSDKIQRVCAGTCDGEWSVGRCFQLHRSQPSILVISSSYLLPLRLFSQAVSLIWLPKPCSNRAWTTAIHPNPAGTCSVPIGKMTGRHWMCRKQLVTPCTTAILLY